MSISICGFLDLNTGEISCDSTKGRPEVLIFGDATQAEADYADVETSDAFILSKTKKARGSSDKLFPLPVIQGTTEKTEAAKYGTLGYGLQIKILRSKPGYEFDMIPGTTAEKQIIKLDGQTIPMRIVDHKRNTWGSTNSAGDVNGIRVLVGVEPAGFEDGQNAKTTKVTVSFIDGADGCENLFGIPTDLLNTDLKGLNDVVLSEKSSHTSNVYHIKGLIKTSVAFKEVNIAEKFGSALADDALWTAKTGTGYATSVTLTSVTVNSAGDGYEVTIDTTEFAALSSGAKIKINLAAPSVLDAADVTDIEGIPLIVTK